jgi:hypothetical protein
MKNLVAILLILVATTATAQYPSWDHSVVLARGESFKKIPISQMIDSINGLQAEKQFEFFEISLKGKSQTEVDQFMKDCKSINSILDAFGKSVIDMAIAPLEKDEINTVSGFYYSFSNTGIMDLNGPTLTVIYPRKDKML